MSRLSAILLLGALCAVPAAAEDEAPLSALDRAKNEFRQGHFSKALDAAEEVEQDDEDYARARYLMGEIQLALDDAGAAEDSFRFALEQRPKSVPILVGLGRSLARQRRFEDAVSILKKAVSLDSKSAPARTHLGAARLRSSEGKRGGKDLRAGVKLAPTDPGVVRAAVASYVAVNQPDKARPLAKRFAKKNKEHPLGPFLMGLLLEKDGKYKDAIGSYEKALERDSAFLDAHKNLAILCIAQNPMYRDKVRTDKAFKHFGEYEKLGGKDERVLRIYQQLKAFFKR